MRRTLPPPARLVRSRRSSTCFDTACRTPALRRVRSTTPSPPSIPPCATSLRSTSFGSFSFHVHDHLRRNPDLSWSSSSSSGLLLASHLRLLPRMSRISVPNGHGCGGRGKAKLHDRRRTRHGDVHVQRLERRVSCEGRRGSGREETRAWMVAWRGAEVRRPTSRAARNDERWTDRICRCPSASSFLLRPKGIDKCASFVGVQPRFAPPATMACRRRTGCEVNATSCVHVEATFRHAFAPRLRRVVAQTSSWMVQDARRGDQARSYGVRIRLEPRQQAFRSAHGRWTVRRGMDAFSFDVCVESLCGHQPRVVRQRQARTHVSRRVATHQRDAFQGFPRPCFARVLVDGTCAMHLSKQVAQSSGLSSSFAVDPKHVHGQSVDVPMGAASRHETHQARVGTLAVDVCSISMSFVQHARHFHDVSRSQASRGVQRRHASAQDRCFPRPQPLQQLSCGLVDACTGAHVRLRSFLHAVVVHGVRRLRQTCRDRGRPCRRRVAPGAETNGRGVDGLWPTMDRRQVLGRGHAKDVGWTSARSATQEMGWSHRAEGTARTFEVLEVAMVDS